MTIRYVGIGGSNANNGTTWALRKLTLAGVEATPVVAGDTVYVGPGTYREKFATAVDGTIGNPITYIADVTGVNTDGIGGVVRVTGSDDDLTATRNIAIDIEFYSYRTFRGFTCDGTTAQAYYISSGSNNIIEDFIVVHCGSQGLRLEGGTNNIIRRGIVAYCKTAGIAYVNFSTPQSSVNHTLENVVIRDILGDFSIGLHCYNFNGVTARNCTITGCYRGVFCETNTSGALTLNNSFVTYCIEGITGQATTNITENYNVVSQNGTNRTNTTSGAQSVSDLPGFAMPLLVNGAIYMTPPEGALASWSSATSKAGTSVPSADMYGTTRLGTSSWGAVQYEATRRPIDAGEPRGRRGIT